MQIIHTALLDQITEKAQKNPRLRMNYNFHESDASASQRLLNGLEPGTVLPVHRHRHTAETYIILRGCIQVVFYDDDKTVIDSEYLNPTEGKFGVNIPAGQWHSVEVMVTGSIIFETKDGPYKPLSDLDILK